jgi:hypothetical protein
MTYRTCLLLLGCALLALTAVPVAEALPPYCLGYCSCSSSCNSFCYDLEIEQVTTCGVFGLCESSSYCNRCSCSGATQGSSGPDNLYGSAYDDCIDGNGGDDTLYGYAGEDDLFGDSGNDTLYGGSGDDCLDGGSGSDSLRGDTGHDVCYNGESYVSCND